LPPTPDIPSETHFCSRASPTPCETGASQSQKTNNKPVYHPTSSTSRATLSSEVTEPFCRLPLHTFCSKLEAIHLEHLLRFVERLDWKMILSLQFSWRTKKAGRRKKEFLLFKRNEKDQRIILVNNSFKKPKGSDNCSPLPKLLFSLF